MRTGTTPLWTGAALILVIACGGATTPAGSPTPSSDQSVTDLATADCRNMEMCQGFNLQANYGDVSTCVSLLGAELSPLAVAPRSGATAAALEACAQAVDALACDQLVPPGVCVFHGIVAIGGPCIVNTQCVAGAYCTTTGENDCGKCAAVATVGEPCLPESCAPGLACVVGSGGSQCAEWAAEGDACSLSSPCAPPFQCVTGTCATPLEAGDPCADSDTPCDSLQGLYCGTSGTCVTMGIAKVGEPCGSFNGVQAVCGGPDAMCSFPENGGLAGTCVPLLADGQPCGGSITTVCAPPSFCSNGVCSGFDAGGCP